MGKKFEHKFGVSRANNYKKFTTTETRRKVRRKSKRALKNFSYQDELFDNKLELVKIRSTKDSYDKGYNYKLVNRFIHNSIGKLWNDTYSQLVKSIPVHSRKDMDNYIRYVVSMNTIIRNGKVYDTSVVYSPDFKYSELTPQSLWIDENGILRQYNSHLSTKFLKPIKEVKEIKVDKFTRIAKLNGIWYFIHFSEDIQNINLRLFMDLHLHIFNHRFDFYLVDNKHIDRLAKKHFDGLFPKSKAQLNKKELKKYGIKNNC